MLVWMVMIMFVVIVSSMGVLVIVVMIILSVRMLAHKATGSCVQPRS